MGLRKEYVRLLSVKVAEELKKQEMIDVPEDLDLAEQIFQVMVNALANVLFFFSSASLARLYSRTPSSRAIPDQRSRVRRAPGLVFRARRLNSSALSR